MIERQYQALEQKVLTTRGSDDVDALRRAFEFASRHHTGQKRASGEPYLSHALWVANILADMQMDVVSIQTGLLHDVVEDTGVSVEEVRKLFGEDVARCVDGVTKLAKLKFYSREERQAESVRKMLLAMV